MSDLVRLELKPTQRRWIDLKWTRLFISLAAAPVLPALFVLLLVFPFNFSAIARASGGAGVIISILWSLFTGAIYLAVVTRRRGILSRAECLLLGVVAAITLPAAIVPCSIFVHSVRDDGLAGLVISDWPERVFEAMVAFGLPAIPLGLFSGWVVWQFGVRPAVPDPAPVFE